MSDGLPVRLTAETADELCSRIELSSGAKLLVRPGQTPRELLEQLIQGRHYLDSVRLLAHALPKREAIWWAVACAKMAHGEPIPAPFVGAIRAVEDWIVDPTDANRRAALPAAEAAGLGTPAGCVCASAYFSGGSLAPVGIADVPPGEHVTAQLVAASVSMAAVFVEPSQAPEKYANYLGLGRKLIDGKAGPLPVGAKGPAGPAGPSAIEAAASAPTTEPAPKRSSLFF
jgi:hypothetical protein